ncbi:MAG: 2-(1,2-epoxy-1,2-dihydrophenyl)acetyl-CoA isomerase, partial [Deltaproteobacteria bacterium]
MTTAALDVGRGGAAVLTLESPDGLNLLGPADIARLIDLVDRAAGNESIRALILTGGK